MLAITPRWRLGWQILEGCLSALANRLVAQVAGVLFGIFGDQMVPVEGGTRVVVALFEELGPGRLRQVHGGH